MMKNSFYQKHLLSLEQLSKDDVLLVLKTAQKIKSSSFPQLLQQKIIAQCFFEPSTRTRLSFESASLRLGAKNIGFSDNNSLSIKKGESLSDTLKVVSSYADLIVLRHPEEGSAAIAAQVSECPVINAGNGANQHPTQTLLDLYTILECQNTLDGLSIGIAGDLQHARTIHSLIEGCSLFNMNFHFAVPQDQTSLPLDQDPANIERYIQPLKDRNIQYSISESLEKMISHVDILYMTRIQKERKINSSLSYQNLTVSLEMLHKAKPNLKILHPLPRLNELPADIDDSPYAYYFQQAKNGVVVRQAILSLILNEALIC
jgi:aspartate carbamoyltransferase catalytic subunit